MHILIKSTFRQNTNSFISSVKVINTCYLYRSRVSVRFDCSLTKNESSKPILKKSEEAVNNILSNMTLQNNKSFLTKHVIDCMVVNELGVLSRVSGVLSGMGINIYSLVVAQTEVNDLSRITIMINGQDEKINRARKQLKELVHVWAVLDYTKVPCVYREMLLIKVPYVRDQSITELVKFFNAKVVDTSLDYMIIELTAKSDKIDVFMELIKPFGILEAIRSGTIVMSRSYIKNTDFIPIILKEQETVDATLLPPG